MLLTTKNYKRVKPHREAKKIVIFSEGMKREVEYFKKLQYLDSRLNIIVYNLKHTEDNSPTGLLEIAKECIKNNEINGQEFEFIANLDELWFLIDTDTWNEKIDELRTVVANEKGWFVAQSNPCFEVWLYYHFFELKPKINETELCEAWKHFLDEKIIGGFNSDKFVLFIRYAIENSKNNYMDKNHPPNYAETEIYKLAEKINNLLDKKIGSMLNKIKMDSPKDYLK